MIWRGFGSDNHAGVHPEVIASIMSANLGHAHGYGEDPWTAEATATLKRHLGDECDIAFVFNGTGANCVSLAAVCRPWESVICASTAHINCDECAAPEHLA
ncbi:MAG: threonine aldolase, partial [Deltaproteobacteria bacterium HGW-Deltaproteobacteria-20]